MLESLTLTDQYLAGFPLIPSHQRRYTAPSQRNPAHPAATSPATAFSMVSCWKMPEAAPLGLAVPVAVPVAASVAVPDGLPLEEPAAVAEDEELGAAEPEEDADESGSTLSVRTPPPGVLGCTVLALWAPLR